jgi:transcriptional regulator with XRE-family HTH domain
VGYRGKLVERERARELRAEGETLLDIARSLGVSKSSVSIWVRDVPFTPRHGRRTARHGEPNALQRAKAAEIERLREEARRRIAEVSDREFLVAGIALYAAEGSKTEGSVRFANSDPRMIAFFCAWLRRFFDVDESRLRVRVYLHHGLDLEAAERFWSDLTAISRDQFRTPYRAIPKVGIRHNKHEHGCPSVAYCCTRTHRTIMGLTEALLAWPDPSGVAQSAEQRIVNPTAVGSSPTPGAPLDP